MPDRFKAALRTLFLARYAQFRKHLHMRLGSEDLANDALQETYLRVENSTVRSEVRYPSAYLFRIALNVAEDQRKSNARLLSVGEVEALYDMADEMADPARGAEARDQLAALGDDGWRAVMRFAATAAALNCTREGADPPVLAAVQAALAQGDNL